MCAGILFLVALLFLHSISGSLFTERGLPPQVEWHTYWEAISLAKSNEKPILVLVTKEWCRHCKLLKEQMRKSSEFWEASRLFNMVSIEENHEMPHDGFGWLPDDYVPRTFFFSPKGVWDRTVVSGDEKRPNLWDFPESYIKNMKWFAMMTAAVSGKPIPLSAFEQKKQEL